MKIALMFSGQPRDIGIAYPYIKKAILDKHDVDVFGFLWYGDRTWECCEPHKYHWGEDDSLKNYLDFIRLYNPKSVRFSHQIEADGELDWNDPREDPLCNRISMWYGWQKCLEIVEEFSSSQGVKYDLLMRFRTDSCPEEEINFEDLRDGSLHIPVSPRTQGYEDHIACGTPEVMRFATRVYECFKSDSDRYSRKVPWSGAHYWSGTHMLDPENTLRRYIDQMRLNVVKQWRLSSNLARYMPSGPKGTGWFDSQNNRTKPSKPFWLTAWKKERGIA
jgi:hypothetical protein